MRVRKDRTGIKVEEAHEGGNRLRAENDTKDPPCSCWRGLAAPRCGEWLLYSGCPGGAMKQVDYRYQEGIRAGDRAHCVADRSGTHVVAESVISRADHNKVVAIVRSGGHNGLRPQMDYQHWNYRRAFHHHHRVTLQARTKFRGRWWKRRRC
ncbi:unnamed protein product [Lactuca virosa]|uniref:Uncharacterized protein n=1 Tax=Lactuca virosa TaxID=75947 RepID=A0AAU9N171_9ASTR|nr:unnamed protein product [Lactuca virosa]